MRGFVRRSELAFEPKGSEHQTPETRGESDWGAFMVSTTGTRPNHYEILGLSPTATADDVKRAYGREILKPRAFGGLAEIGIAFATLQDPVKRRAYDQSIGLVRKPEPKPLHASWSWSVHVPAPGKPVAAAVPASEPASIPSPDTRPETAPRRRESLIAASLRELADPAAISQAQALRRAPVARPPAIPEPWMGAPAAELPDAATIAIEWRRPAMIGGGLLLAAVVFGAWAGMAVRDPGVPVELEARVTMPVPSAKARSVSAAPQLQEKSETRLTESRPLQLAGAPVRVVSPRDSESPQASVPRPIPLTAQEEQELAGESFAETAVSQAPEAAEAIAQPAESAGPVSAARLPLSERIVARTIGRIGYACGAVASIAPVDATPGVFKVTCTSGHSYQARPVRGRYHFRRWGRS